MKYKYVIDMNMCDYSIETVLLHDTKYTKEEFDTICKECIKESLLTKLSAEPIQLMTSDGEILECQKYEFGEYVTAWTNNDYRNIDYIQSNLFNLLKLKGFEIELTPIEVRFCANEYTYITENFSDEISSLFAKRHDTEKFLIVSDEIAHDVCSYLESNAKTVDEIDTLINLWIESNK